MNSRIGKWLLKKAIKKTQQRKKKEANRQKLWKISAILLLVGIGLLFIAVLAMGAPFSGALISTGALVATLYGMLGYISLLVSFFTFFAGLFSK